MKKLTNQTIFKCEYCSKISKSGGGIRLHEVTCKNNPSNYSPCTSCEKCEKEILFYDKDNNLISEEDYRYIFSRKYHPFLDENEDVKKPHHETQFICLNDNKKMYHNKINRLSKKIRQEIISRCDKQMPLECEYYKPNFSLI